MRRRARARTSCSSFSAAAAPLPTPPSPPPRARKAELQAALPSVASAVGSAGCVRGRLARRARLRSHARCQPPCLLRGAPHPPLRKGGTSNRSRPGRGHGTLAGGERAVGAQPAAYLRQKGALRIPLPSALGARAPRGSRPTTLAAAGVSLSPPPPRAAAVVVLWRARFELDLKVTSSSAAARMVASPPPPLLSAVPPQQQQQQRYGLPPAPLSPLLPAPSTPTIMASAGVPAADRPTPSRASEIRRVSGPSCVLAPVIVTRTPPRDRRPSPAPSAAAVTRARARSADDGHRSIDVWADQPAGVVVSSSLFFASSFLFLLS